MKKLFGVLLLTLITSISANANEFSTVCANHILVPTEMDAVKIRSQIKTFLQKKFAGSVWMRPQQPLFRSPVI